MTDTVQILQFVEDHDEFLITYYAKKHNEIITRRELGRNQTQIRKANISNQKTETISLFIGI